MQSMTPNRYRTARLLLATLLLGPVAASADDSLQWNGFLNVVGGVARYPGTDDQHLDRALTESGYTNTLTFDNETSAGLQATKSFDSHDTITLQVFADGTDDYAGKIKWLYVSHPLTDNDTLRAGKLDLPLFYFSDFQKVGYAYHWISPPKVVYPFDVQYTGVDWIHKTTIGETDVSMETLAGSQHQTLPGFGLEFSAHALWGTILNASQGPFSVRAAALTELQDQRLDSNFDPERLLNDAYDSVLENPALSAQEINLLTLGRTSIITAALPSVESIRTDSHRVSYTELAARYETENYFLMAEATRFMQQSYLFNMTKEYLLTGGIRRGAWLLHATRTRYFANLSNLAAEDLDIIAREDPRQQFGDVFMRSVRSGIAMGWANEHNGWSIGANRELNRNAVLKFQLDYAEDRPGAPGDRVFVGYNTIFRTAIDLMF